VPSQIQSFIKRGNASSFSDIPAILETEDFKKKWEITSICMDKRISEAIAFLRMQMKVSKKEIAYLKAVEEETELNRNWKHPRKK